ncbi:hypothetical protein LTR08_005412 [Meristemomyces frigidus]|nr:hypothetical protein LTR08_005412 [Meristemomyces frigidus]
MDLLNDYLLFDLLGPSYNEQTHGDATSLDVDPSFDYNGGFAEGHEGGDQAASMSMASAYTSYPTYTSPTAYPSTQMRQSRLLPTTTAPALAQGRSRATVPQGMTDTSMHYEPSGQPAEAFTDFFDSVINEFPNDTSWPPPPALLRGNGETSSKEFPTAPGLQRAVTNNFSRRPTARQQLPASASTAPLPLNFSERDFWAARSSLRLSNGRVAQGTNEQLFVMYYDLQLQITQNFGWWCMHKPLAHVVRPALSDMSRVESENVVVGKGKGRLHEPSPAVHALQTSPAAGPSGALQLQAAADRLKDGGIEAHHNNAASGASDIVGRADYLDPSLCRKFTIAADDWQTVEMKTEELAQECYDALTATFDRAPTGIKLSAAFKSGYLIKQDEALNVVVRKLATGEGSSIAKLNCKKLVHLVVCAHKFGVPEKAFAKWDAKRAKTSVALQDKLNPLLRCSERAAAVVNALKSNKRLAVDVASGRSLEGIVYHPQGMVLARVDLFKSNMARAVTNKRNRALAATEKAEREVDVQGVEGEGSRAKRAGTDVFEQGDGDGSSGGDDAMGLGEKQPPAKKARKARKAREVVADLE